jgi:hypothetical protein
MLPLALANVYIAALLAKERYRGITLLIIISISYALVLIALGYKQSTPSKEAIILTLGVFNLLYLVAAKYLTKKLEKKIPQPSAVPES